MCEDINFSLTSAILDGNLKRVRELLDYFGFSNCESEGYDLLVEAILNGRTEIAKLLLMFGCKVNNKNRKKHNYNTPLILAITSGYAEIVEMLLHRGADIHVRNTCGSTVLHTAVQQGNRKIIKLLLDHGADVHVVNNNGINSLHLASTEQYIQIAEDLLNHGANINSVCVSELILGYTALHFSSEQGNEEAVKLFLSKGADVGATTSDNLTPLHIAVKAELETVVKLLLEHGAKVDAQDKIGNTVLHLAVEIGNSKIVEDILKYRPDINNQSNRNSFKTAVCGSRESYKEIVESLLRYGFIVHREDVDNPELLRNAVEEGYLKIVEDLLKNGADANILDNSIPVSCGTLLHSAAINKQDEVAKLLIDYGANVNAKNGRGITPVFCAVQNNDVKITRLLLSNGAVIKDTPDLLYSAAENGYLEIVEVLLKNGADVNMLDNSISVSGGTLLHSAAINKQDEVAKLLINYGANVNAKDRKGRTPVFYAVENSDVKITKLLLTNGADIKSSRRLLHIAASNGYLEIVEDLLKHGAQVNVSDHSTYGSGGTPLHSAVRKNRKEVAKLLVKYGANVNAKDEMGKTPVFYAVANSDARITSLLVTNGADIRDNSELMHSAAVNGCLKIVEELLMYDADVNISDQSTNGNGGTPLHSAVRKNRGKVAKLLVYYGANVNAKDGRGKTPLYYAVENNDVKITRLLLTNGVDIEGGPELLYVAIENKCKKIVDILLKHGANVNVIIRDCTPLAFAMSDYNFLSDEDYDDYDYDDGNDNFAEKYKFRRTRASTEIVELLKKHIVKLQVAGLYVHERNLQLIIDDPEIINFQRECKREIAIMKPEKISNSCVSFYYILTKNRNQLATYANNENVVLAIRLVDHKIKFPIYASMIERKFREGRERIKLMELGKQLFYSLFENLSELPLLCIEKIFSYLSNYDLKLLIRK